MNMEDFIMTMDSDTEGISESKNPRQLEESGLQLDPEFSFDLAFDSYVDILDDRDGPGDLIRKGSKLDRISVDDIVAKRRISQKRKRDFKEIDGSGREEGHSDMSESDDEPDVSSSNEEGVDLGVDDVENEDSLSTSEDQDGSDLDSEPENDSNALEESADNSSAEDSESETQAEKERKAAFFDSDTNPSKVHSSFLTMNLSRPILKAIATLGFHKPTPIQAATIPVALLGKDVVGGAVTGSGKTAAFIIPMLERLLYRERGKKAAAIRCLVLVPTRELAVQCFEVGTRLATHTDVRFCLVVGGLSMKSQEVALRSRPDILIATPGRLIDHIRNSHSFSLDNLDILVLDEADRMLSDGFSDELTEIIKFCPNSRQTMLFSATMTDSIDELVRVSLKKPVRLFVDPKKSIARGLVQEFVRVRAGKEAERTALLVALCKRSFKAGVIIFVRSKRLAHQLRTVFSLLDMKCEELHGNLSQEQRLKSLQAFRDGSVNFLIATDLAARGLDIKGIETVINYDMPAQLTQYLHRVGRTARAGKNGRSVTLVGELDRKLLKAAIKHSAGEDQVRHRVVSPEAVSKWSTKLKDMKEDVAAVLQEEKEEKELRQAEMELSKGQNMIDHEAEIYSRPARTWFQSGKEKKIAEATSKKQHEDRNVGVSKGNEMTAVNEKKPKRDQYSGLSRKAKRRKLAMKVDEEMADTKSLNAAIRTAKKSARPTKIGVPESRAVKLKGRMKKSDRRKSARGGSGFEHDIGQKRTRNEGSRAKKKVRTGKGVKQKGR